MAANIDTNIFSVDTQENIEQDIREFENNLSHFKGGGLTEVEFKHFRLLRGIYGQRNDQPGFNMVRVKLPGGVITAAQLRRLGRIADSYADGKAHITTRQDIQFHWVKLETVPDVMRELAEAGMTTREACGNTVRNIIGSPFAGVSTEEAFDVTPYVLALSEHLIRNKLTSKLPRKFKISFSGCETDKDGIIPWIHDIGFVAKSFAENGNVKRGFKIYTGGGLGAHPRVADIFDEFVPEELLVPTTESIITIFDRYGDHKNRRRARMKYIIWKLGLHRFRQLVHEERDRLTGNGRFFPEPVVFENNKKIPPAKREPVNGKILSREFELWKLANVFPQKQFGYNFIIINPVIGDLSTEQLLSLAEIAEHFSDGTVRTSVSQDIVLRWINSKYLTEVFEQLKAAGLDYSGANSLANVTSCPGADTCNLGITFTRALGKELTTLFEKNSGWSDLLKDMRIKISGCPNSCGQHHVASIGFYGCVRKIKGRYVPHYIMLIGGGLHSGRNQFGDVIMKIPARRVSDTVLRIVKIFLTERKEDEDFWTYCKRVNPKSFKEKLRDLAFVPDYETSPEWFIDLGQESEFDLRLGKGECMS